MENNNSHIRKLEHALGKLQNEVRDLEYAEKINQVFFDISNAVNTTIDLEELYKSIHESLKKLLPLPNFFISIMDKEKDLLYFPYHEDSLDGSTAFDPRSYKIPSLTKEVITGREPLFLTKEGLKEREKQGRVCGIVPAVWIGAPLFISDQVIGVMAMYSYDDPDIFTKQNMDLFVSISNQVALAIDRKYAIENFLDNEETFRALTENFDDIIMRFDRSYRHLYVSPAVRYLKLEPGKMIGKTHEELGFSSDLANHWKREIEKVFVTKKTGRSEFYLPQGVWLDWLLCPEFSSKGEVVAVITSARDITNRKILELQRMSLNRINQIIISATDLDAMLDNVLNEVQKAFLCDRVWIGHFNMNAHEFEVLNEYDFPDSARIMDRNTKVQMSQKAVNEISKLAESGGICVFNQQEINQLNSEASKEYNIQSMMTLPIHVEEDVTWLFGLHQCNKEKVWTLAEQDFFKQIGQRITDGLNNMLLHRKLRDAKNYIDSIIDSMPSALIGVDNFFKITELNSKAENYAGIKIAEVKGKKLCSVFPYLEPQLEKITHAMKDQKVTGETKIPRQINGNLCYENITIYPLVDEIIKGAVIRIDEVTEQVRLEEMMIQSEKMLSVGGLAAGMAHEINNPLAGMMQNAQVVKNRLLEDLPANHNTALEVGTSMEILKNYLSKRKIPEMLENINKAGDTAATIVQNMLSFAHKQTGIKVFNNLPDLIDKTIDLAQHDYNLKKKYDFRDIEIIREYDRNLPDIMCEASMIQQVIFNILKNGTEAMFGKFGNAGDEARPQFLISLSKEDKKVCIEIQDNGPGMSDDIAKRVFDPFFTTKGPDQGTGLGLSVSYFIIVENHKGEITVESIPEHGSTFIIKLPIN